MTFITKIEKSTLKFIWKHKRLQITKAILSKERNAGGTTIPHFKLYYRAKAIKTAWYWHKNRSKVQWNGTQDKEMNPHSYTHVIFDKVTKNVMMEKRQTYQQIMLGKVTIGLQKTETRPIPVSLYVYQLKVD
jgi:hypothetical protein